MVYEKKRQSKGFFLSIEGIDGAGKTTLAKQLEEKLREEGYSVVLVREPGGTVISEKIRELLLDPGNSAMALETEALLYNAARAQLVDEIIEPSLAAGMIVICDRFIDSTLAYQGGGRGIKLEWLRTLNQLASRGLTPEITILLDVDPREGKRRKEKTCIDGQRFVDRMEIESEPFYERVREFFLELSKQDAQRFRVVNAGQPFSKVCAEVWYYINKYISERI